MHVDDGCEVAPKCLSCPLPACRYDREANRPSPIRELQIRQRQEKARAMRREGRSFKEIAAGIGHFAADRLPLPGRAVIPGEGA